MCLHVGMGFKSACCLQHEFYESADRAILINGPCALEYAQIAGTRHWRAIEMLRGERRGGPERSTSRKATRQIELAVPRAGQYSFNQSIGAAPKVAEHPERRAAFVGVAPSRWTSGQHFGTTQEAPSADPALKAHQACFKPAMSSNVCPSNCGCSYWASSAPAWSRSWGR